MYPILTPMQMRELDHKASGDNGGFLYMQKAGEALFRKTCELLDEGTWKQFSSLRTPTRVSLPKGWQKRPVLIFSGHGNNGGDGIVLAELLRKSARPYVLVLFRDPTELHSEAGDAWKNYSAKGGEAVVVRSVEECKELLQGSGLVVDAMVGIGSEGPLRGIFTQVLETIQKTGNPVFAVDAPTGTQSLSATKVENCAQALQSDWTLLLGYPRIEAFFEECGQAFGEWDIADLGYEDTLIAPYREEQRLFLCQKSDVSKFLPKRNSWVDKRRQGVVGIVAGSRGMTGAATMCSQAALRSGAGMVHLATPLAEIPVLSSKLTEVVLHGMDSANGTLLSSALPSVLSLLSRSNAGCVGPGLSIQEETQKLVRQLILDVSCPLVLDADGINAFKGYSAMLRGLKHPPVLTPHDGEWERLFRSKPGEGMGRIHSLREKCTEYRCVIVLKGAPTLIGTPEGIVYLVPVANSGLAKAGSGDLLAGVISSFLAQGANSVQASLLGTWIHGRAALLAVNQFGARGVLPSDVLGCIPFAILELEKENCVP